MDKLTYSTDTTAVVPGASLTAGRGYGAATGNSTKGYFGGGFSAPLAVDKLTYSTDTTVSVPGASLSPAGGYNRNFIAATGNSSAGYFGGGANGNTALMDKVTYASDTNAAVPGAFLTLARYSLAAVSARANALPTTTTAPAPNIV